MYEPWRTRWTSGLSVQNIKNLFINVFAFDRRELFQILISKEKAHPILRNWSPSMKMWLCQPLFIAVVQYLNLVSNKQFPTEASHLYITDDVT